MASREGGKPMQRLSFVLLACALSLTSVRPALAFKARDRRAVKALLRAVNAPETNLADLADEFVRLGRRPIGKALRQTLKAAVPRFLDRLAMHAVEPHSGVGRSARQRDSRELPADIARVADTLQQVRLARRVHGKQSRDETLSNVVRRKRNLIERGADAQAAGKSTSRPHGGVDGFAEDDDASMVADSGVVEAIDAVDIAHLQTQAATVSDANATHWANDSSVTLEQTLDCVDKACAALRGLPRVLQRASLPGAPPDRHWEMVEFSRARRALSTEVQNAVEYAAQSIIRYGAAEQQPALVPRTARALLEADEIPSVEIAPSMLDWAEDNRY